MGGAGSMKSDSMAGYGEQTAAAVANFGRGRTPREVIRALAEVKEACLRALQATEKPWSEPVFAAVVESLEEIRAGDRDDLFPLDLAQGGAGTSLHMNICEVLASCVAEKTGRADAFHFLDDGARSQSTNDVVTTAAVVVVQRLIRRVETAVIALQEALVKRERVWRGVLVTGRTEWQDALPMDLSLAASAWAGSAERDRWRLSKLKERSRTVPIGGTAVGTGAGAAPAYVFAAERLLREITALPLQRSQNLADAIAQRDDFAEVAGGFGLVAANLHKLCGDLFFYTSSVVGELALPALQWGSTAMPAKNNPVLVEYCAGLAVRASASASAIVRYAEEGRLQLNAFTPFMVDAFLRAATDLEAALGALSSGLLPRLVADPRRAVDNLARSAAPLNALRADLPYERLKAIATDRGSTVAAGTDAAGMDAAGMDAAVSARVEYLCADLAGRTGLPLDLVRSRLGLSPAARAYTDTL